MVADCREFEAVVVEDEQVHVPKVEPSPNGKSQTTQPGSNLKRRFGIKHNVALLMAVTVLILNVIAWRATERPALPTARGPFSLSLT